MPSSPRRSAASMMKMRKMSRIPAAMENEPNVVNIETKAAPIASAVFRASRLVGFAWRPSGASAGRSILTTWPVSATPDVVPPRFETSTYLILPGWPRSSCAAASGISTAAPSVPAPS